MNTLWDTIDANYNIVKLLNGRERKVETAKTLANNFQFTGPFLRRLGLEHQLEGHEGCVNCLQWSDDGRLLASGSDDTNVIIWDPFRHKKLVVVPTRHIGNIFSVKFIGDGSLIVTGAGDSRVIVQAVSSDSKHAPILDCGCHVSRVKRIATAPDQPQLFWSASEDGLVLQFDMREPHECMVKSKVFLDLSYTNEFKCIAVNPTRPHYIAIGANDCFVRYYDRRMVKLSKYRSTHSLDVRKRVPPEPQDPDCVQYFSPGHLARDNGGEFHYKISVTYVSFNSAGTELLVNMGGDHVYLYDLNNERHVNQLKVPEWVPKRPEKRLEYRACCLRAENINYGNNGYHLKPMQKHNYKISESDKKCVCAFIDRAVRLFQRKWTGDIYAAARDYLYVIERWPDYEKAYLGLIECLISLKWRPEAQSWIEYYKKTIPSFNATALNKLEDLLEVNTSSSGSEEPENLQNFDISETEKNLRLNSCDFETRYIGHCNTTTDIKEASYLGEEGDFICAGSDDGMIFIWDRKTTNVLTALIGDFSIVNCVQPHPSACFLASSGIDPVVKLWSPRPEDARNPNVVEDPWVAIEENQKRMVMDPFETMLANIGYHLRDSSPSDTSTLHQIPSCRTS